TFSLLSDDASPLPPETPEPRMVTPATSALIPTPRNQAVPAPAPASGAAAGGSGGHTNGSYAGSLGRGEIRSRPEGDRRRRHVAPLAAAVFAVAVLVGVSGRAWFGPRSAIEPPAATTPAAARRPAP